MISPGDLCTLDVGDAIVRVKPMSRIVVNNDGSWHSDGGWSTNTGQVWNDDVLFAVAVTGGGRRSLLVGEESLGCRAIYVIAPRTIGWFNGSVLIPV